MLHTRSSKEVPLLAFATDESKFLHLAWAIFVSMAINTQ